MFSSILRSFNRAPARWAATFQAVVALVAVYVPDLPQAAILALIAAVTGVGFVAQSVENGKTQAALWTDPTDN